MPNFKVPALTFLLAVPMGSAFAQMQPLIQLSDTPMYQQAQRQAEQQREQQRQRELDEERRRMQQQLEQLQQQQQQMRQQMQK